ncbi:MAG TPA: hypothetical protein VFZ58_02945 [Candidatus Saccharimonadales bacterium]
MSDVPQDQQAASDDTSQQNLQGYQDDFDTAKKDEFANENGDDPSKVTPATPSELREGLENTAGNDQEGAEPGSSEDDDWREEIEDRDEENGSRGPV